MRHLRIRLTSPHLGEMLLIRSKTLDLQQHMQPRRYDAPGCVGRRTPLDTLPSFWKRLERKETALALKQARTHPCVPVIPPP